MNDQRFRELTVFRQTMTERARAKVTDPTMIEYIADMNLMLDMLIRELPIEPKPDLRDPNL